MNKKTIGITLAASALIAGLSFVPAANAQVSAHAEALARQNAQQAAEGEAAFGEQMGIPRAANQHSIQKKYNDTYNAQMSALGAQGNLLPSIPGATPYSTPYYGNTTVNPYTGYPYNYNRSNNILRQAGRFLNFY